MKSNTKIERGLLRYIFSVLLFVLLVSTLQAAGWTQIGDDIDGEAAGDRSGGSVSLSADGTIVAIGAPQNDGSNGTHSGHVRVYQNLSGTWTKIGSDIDGEAGGDWSGTSVSLSADGTIVAIGAPNNSSNAGHTRIYGYSGGSWTQIGSDRDGEVSDAQSGWSVSMSADGTIVAIGAKDNDDIGSSAGHVRVFGLASTYCGEGVNLALNEWIQISRPCGTETNPTFMEVFEHSITSPEGNFTTGNYGDGGSWVVWKFDGTIEADQYIMIANPTAETMKLGIGYWFQTNHTSVVWDNAPDGVLPETWYVKTEGTVAADGSFHSA